MNDLEYSRMRLEKILSSRKLNYNPYEVSNEELIQTFNSFTWGNSFEITDSVIMNFTEIRKLEWINSFEALVYTLGSWSDEHIISINRFFDDIKANDSHKNIYTILNGRPFSSIKEIKNLVGKKVLVTHCIGGNDTWGKSRNAYFMHTLHDDIAKDAKIIRSESFKSKLEMLNRLLQYPESCDYLNCTKSLFDLETPIKEKIEMIKKYPYRNL